MKEILEIQKITEGVEGFLSQNGKNLREGEVLYHLARKSEANGVIAEIGSWKGKSTIWIGKGAEIKGVKVYAIDPHIGSLEHQVEGKKIWTFDDFKKNIEKAGLAQQIHPIVKTSKEALKEIKTPIHFLFIDGAHAYEEVKEDLTLWFPKVKTGGVIAFHDSFVGWPGVTKLVNEEVFTSPYFSKVRYLNSITYGIKTDRATFIERCENYIALLVKQIHEKSLSFPQPLKSFIKHLIWAPFQKRWLKELTNLGVCSQP